MENLNNTEKIFKLLGLDLLTKSQIDAITSNSPVLVSASAGSGKTFTLCNRILFKLCNNQHKLTIQNLLVVSFTKLAANEIYNRIKNKLFQLIKQYPKNIMLKKQLNCLSQNNITTIDSFCSNFLKEHFDDAKISPNFKIGNEIEILELKQKILNEIFEEEYEKDANNFQYIINYFSLNSDSGLKKAILKLFEKSRTNPFPEHFLAYILKQNKRTNSKKANSLAENNKITEPIKQEIIDRIIEAKFLIVSAISQMDDPVLQKSFRPVFEQTATNLNNLAEKIENSKYIDIKPLIQTFNFDNLPRYSKKNNAFDQDLADYIKTNFFYPAKKLINSIQTLLIDENQFLNDYIKQKPIICKLINLCFIFSKRLAKEKEKLNILEFSDLLLKTIKLLAKPKDKTFKLTPLGEKTKEMFDEILIDEFQDINKPQELLFNILSNSGKNLFAVGDLKQSIYRFRQADPEIFINYRNLFNKENKKIILLKENFRSRSEITNAVNFLFGQIMTNKFGGVDYEESEALISFADFKKNKDHITELHILTNDSETNNLVFEMQHVALQIKTLIHNGFQILEDKKLIPCKPKHFAILLRSEKGVVDILCKELDKLNLPYSISEKNQFLNSYEVSIVISILKIVDNPLNDIAFCAVALSPLFNFTYTELTDIKLNSDKDHLFLTFIDSDNKKCKLLLNMLYTLRQNHITMSISQLIQYLYDVDIFNKLFLQDYNNAKTIMDNLQQFANLISHIEQNEYNLNLTKLLNMLTLAKNSNLTLNSQQTSNLKVTNAITITTIHKSKGLEFPIVFIPLCSKKFNEQDFNTPIIISNKFGIGLKHSIPKTLTRYNTLSFNCIAINEKNEAKAEELRLLYVAMTRAQQKLFLVALDNNQKFKSLTTPNSKILPASFCRTKKSFYDWLLLGFSRHQNFHFNFQQINFEKDEFRCDLVIKNKFSNNYNISIDIEQNKAEVDLNLINQLKNQLSFKLKKNILCQIPAKISVSELSKTNNSISLRKLSFDNAITPEEIGTATHNFLQHANFKLAKQNLNKEIDRLIMKEFISKKQANCLNKKQLLNFFNSKIFELIEKSSSIQREKNFIFEMYSDKTGNIPIIVQGSIDLLLEKDGKLIVVDYKTDRISNNKLKELYQNQLKIYKLAMENLTHKPVTKCLIYSLYSNSVIEV